MRVARIMRTVRAVHVATEVQSETDELVRWGERPDSNRYLLRSQRRALTVELRSPQKFRRAPGPNWSRARLLTASRCATERGGMPANSVRCAAYSARTCLQRTRCRRRAGQRLPGTTSGEGFQSDFTGFFPDRGLLSSLQPSAQRQSRPGELSAVPANAGMTKCWEHAGGVEPPRAGFAVRCLAVRPHVCWCIEMDLNHQRAAFHAAVLRWNYRCIVLKLVCAVGLEPTLSTSQTSRISHLPHTEKWWRQPASIRRPSACKADALPSELCPHEHGASAGHSRRRHRHLHWLRGQYGCNTRRVAVIESRAHSRR